MKAIYRKYEEHDVKDLNVLMGQLGYKHSETSLSENVAAVRKTGGEIFVVEISGKVSGCVCAILDVRLASGVKGEIVSLVVLESKRGCGLGRGLVSTAEAWLKERVKDVRIRANINRLEAHEFYKSLGYSLSKTQRVFSKNV